MARKAGVDPVNAILVMCSMLPSQWNEPEEFLNDLGKNDPAAILEARSQFNLHPME
ncbi:MAG: hypothetical protein M0T73_00010 [Deltaproteobacteria bacterium]|nr:hypothetical protein [Deltaproteobacteria bacterium]